LFILVFALLAGAGNLAFPNRFKGQDLRLSHIGLDDGRQWHSIRNLHCNETKPFRAAYQQWGKSQDKSQDSHFILGFKARVS